MKKDTGKPDKGNTPEKNLGKTEKHKVILRGLVIYPQIDAVIFYGKTPARKDKSL
jgi:hypothetical protein